MLVGHWWTHKKCLKIPQGKKIHIYRKMKKEELGNWFIFFKDHIKDNRIKFKTFSTSQSRIIGGRLMGYGSTCIICSTPPWRRNEDVTTNWGWGWWWWWSPWSTLVYPWSTMVDHGSTHGTCSLCQEMKGPNNKLCPESWWLGRCMIQRRQEMKWLSLAVSYII